jgi:hypothetical protein
MSIPNDPTQSVTRMLGMLKQEWPEYMNDNDQMIAAALALAHCLGAVGAIVLLKGGEDRLDKMQRMVATNVKHTAHEGAAALKKRDQTSDEVRTSGPLSDDEILRRIALKNGKGFLN